MLIIGLLAWVSMTLAGQADPPVVSPNTGANPSKQNIDNRFTDPEEVVKKELTETTNKPQEPIKPGIDNARIREIASRIDLIWPSDRPKLQSKPRGAASAEGVLRTMGQSDDPETRRRAVEGLRVLGDGLEGPELLKALQDSSPAVREAAASSLVTAPPELAFVAVLTALTAGTPDERASIELVLPRLRESLEKPMLGVLMDADDTVDRRKAAAFSLGRMRSSEALRVLVDLSWSGEPMLAAYSADALAYMGNPSTVLDLVDLLGHVNPDVRYAAVEGLGRIGGPDAVNALSELVTSESENRSRIRQLAVGMLGRIGGPDSAPTLIRAMAAPDMAVRQVAGGELHRLTGMDFGPEPALWETWYVEMEAARRQAQRPQRNANSPPLVPSLPMELPPGVKLDEGDGTE